MPGITVHAYYAQLILEYWQKHSSEAPFDPICPEAQNAFFHGAFGPDIGYLPGGEPLLSDLTHYVLSGDFSRTLIQTAKTSVEKAYAWGWFTHVLADVLFHPVINQAHGERVLGDREKVLTYADDQVTHAQVEFGADTVVAVSSSPPSIQKLEPAFTSVNISFLVKAFKETYGVDFSPDTLLRAHKVMGKTYKVAVWVSHLIGLHHTKRPKGFLRNLFWWSVWTPLRLLSSLLGRKFPLYPVTHSFSPPAWLVEELTSQSEEFTHQYLEYYKTELQSLQNYNLDTGKTKEEEDSYPPREDAQKRLKLLLEKNRPTQS